jgi:hypothetical protein
MRNWILASLALVPACLADVTATDEPDLGAYLPPADGKLDDVARCGEDSCARSLCGFSCEAGALCEQQCFAEDVSDASFVRFEVGGASSLELDTRHLPGPAPYARFSNIVIAGLDLWQFRAGFGQPITRNGLEIMYWDVIEAGIVANHPFRHGPWADLYIAEFTGPGVYAAQAKFSPGKSRAELDGPVVGDRYAGACQVTVTTAANGGLDGAFQCEALAGVNASSSVRLAGSFHAAPTSIDRPTFFAKP